MTSQVGFDGGGIPLGIGLASKVLLSLLLVWAAVVHLPPDLALAGCLLVDAGHGCSSLLVLTVFASCDTNAWLPLAFDAPLGDPVGDVLLVEANELSDLVIRHAVLFDESSYEPFGNAEAFRNGGDVEQHIAFWDGRNGLHELAANSSHAAQSVPGWSLMQPLVGAAVGGIGVWRMIPRSIGCGQTAWP